ncbi:RHS repeat-associated core domain-containing protein [Shewanella sp. VB17]|uniref:RHS repeat-associated core domain-containing protein n=1 Tax=Shewanella sp. VB17 TaxID=2739432 RepID=UPI001564985B|nr:RHS repeat-associated core domain-containing protein [Shewanella sp. VB17]NRD73996.1 RHS repeat-associated core domain-containing protein [Shewanella sp. VB17]
MKQITSSDASSLPSSVNASRRRFMKQSSLLIAASPLAGLSPVIASAAGQIVKVSASESSLAKNSLGFNGERQDSATGLYHLGKGYRVYNPALMRFHASDSMSPFGKGGINSYAYCLGDPINLKDPSGHFALMSLLIGAIVGAVVGASISAAAEGIRAAATDTKFDWKQVGIGAALGFISGGFGAAAVGAKTGAQVGLAVADAVVSGAADFGLNVAAGVDTKQAGINAGIGAVIGLATFGVGMGSNAKVFKDPRRALTGGAGSAKVNKAYGSSHAKFGEFDNSMPKLFAGEVEESNVKAMGSDYSDGLGPYSQGTEGFHQFIESKKEFKWIFNNKGLSVISPEFKHSVPAGGGSIITGGSGQLIEGKKLWINNDTGHYRTTVQSLSSSIPAWRASHYDVDIRQMVNFAAAFKF